MWKYLLITLLIFGLSVNTTHAETTLQEFLDAAPQIAEAHLDEYYNVSWEVVNLLSNEFDLRYGDTATWDEIAAAYDTLSGYGFRAPFGVTHYYLDPRSWNLRIIERWLEESSPDFENRLEIIFEPYTLQLETYDFDADGVDEWLIYVSGNDFADIWVAWRDSTQPAGYRLDVLPIPHTEVGQSWTYYEGHGSTLEYIGDVNGDGTLEMLFSAWSMAPASWSHATNKALFLVGLTDGDFGGLINTSINTYAENYDWRFSNLDDDTAEEFIVRYLYADNWGCHRTETHIFDWDGQLYIETASVSDFEPTLYCDLRTAEELTTQNDYVEAIPFYESALLRFETLTGAEREAAAPFAAFAQERLVIAYAFADRLDDARALLDELRTPPPPANTIAAALVAVPVDELDAERMCRAAYDAMEATTNPYEREEDYYRGAIIPGLDETWYGDNSQVAYWGGNSGCNYDGLVRMRIENAVYPIDQSPADILQTLGVTVDRTLTLDLNGDSTEDWLIWVSLYNAASPLIFLSEGESYTEPTPISFTASENGFVVALPDGAEAWLQPLPVTWQTCLDSPSQFRFGRIQSYTLFQFDGEHFNALSFGLCSDTPIAWRAAEYIEAWQQIQLPRSEPFYQPAPLVWNAEHSVYQVKTRSAVSVADQEAARQLYNLLYQQRQYTEALVAADTLLLDSETAMVTYYRAVTLDMLGRTHEAQAAYQRVIELDTNSVYADLANLWLEG